MILFYLLFFNIIAVRFRALRFKLPIWAFEFDLSNFRKCFGTLILWKSTCCIKIIAYNRMITFVGQLHVLPNTLPHISNSYLANPETHPFLWDFTSPAGFPERIFVPKIQIRDVTLQFQ